MLFQHFGIGILSTLKTDYNELCYNELGFNELGHNKQDFQS